MNQRLALILVVGALALGCSRQVESEYDTREFKRECLRNDIPTCDAFLESCHTLIASYNQCLRDLPAEDLLVPSVAFITQDEFETPDLTPISKLAHYFGLAEADTQPPYFPMEGFMFEASPGHVNIVRTSLSGDPFLRRAQIARAMGEAQSKIEWGDAPYTSSAAANLVPVIEGVFIQAVYLIKDEGEWTASISDTHQNRPAQSDYFNALTPEEYLVAKWYQHRNETIPGAFLREWQARDSTSIHKMATQTVVSGYLPTEYVPLHTYSGNSFALCLQQVGLRLDSGSAVLAQNAEGHERLLLQVPAPDRSEVLDFFAPRAHISEGWIVVSDE